MKAPKISAQTIEHIVQLLDSWTENLTWKIFIKESSLKIGHAYTKAALLRHPRIKSAWIAAKNKSRTGSPGVAHGNVATEILKARLRKLESEISELKRENSGLLEQFLRWSYNAAILGISQDQLDRPIPVARPR